MTHVKELMPQGVSKVSTPCDQDRNDKAERHARVQWIAFSARSQPNLPARANDKKSHADKNETKLRAPFSNTHGLSKAAEQALCLEVTSPREEGRCREDKATRINKVRLFKGKNVSEQRK